MTAQLLISVGGIALTVFIAWALGFRGKAVLADAAEAERIAAQALSGFHPVAASLAADGRGAEVRAADGRVARLTPLGDRWVVRLA